MYGFVKILFFIWWHACISEVLRRAVVVGYVSFVWSVYVVRSSKDTPRL